jgi:uncharacterized protein
MRRGLLLGAVLGRVVVLLGRGAPLVAQQSLTWTAGAVGGGWYAISNGMAELMREKTGLSIKVIPGGGTQNAVLVEKGGGEIGMGLPPLLRAGLNGEDPYEGQKMADLRAIVGNMSLNTLHFFVGSDTRFAAMTMDEIIRGKKPIRLAISKPGSSDVWLLEKVMQFYGLSAGDRIEVCYKTWEAASAKFFRGSYTEQARAFVDRLVDGMFASLALPGASIDVASVGRRLKLLAFPEPILEHLGTFGLGKGTIPARTYPKASNGNEPQVSATMATTVIVSSGQRVGEIGRHPGPQRQPDRVRKIHESLADYDPAHGYLKSTALARPGAGPAMALGRMLRNLSRTNVPWHV